VILAINGRHKSSRRWSPVVRLVALVLITLALRAAQADERFITLSSTASTQDSGLFGHILPIFKAASGIAVHVVAVGTAHALAIAARGDADALLVHDRPGEDKFVADGFGIDRRDVMYNDFVVVGPSSDPAHIRGLKNAREALKRIAQAAAPFASRGDDSGTNRMELRLWKSAGVQPDPHSGWYRDLGQGMGATLNTAAAMNANLDRGRPGSVQPLRQHSDQSREVAACQVPRGQNLARMADVKSRA
jgi:tungstate transport system substrate-binding protein